MRIIIQRLNNRSNLNDTSGAQSMFLIIKIIDTTVHALPAYFLPIATQKQTHTQTQTHTSI